MCYLAFCMQQLYMMPEARVPILIAEVSKHDSLFELAPLGLSLFLDSGLWQVLLWLGWAHQSWCYMLYGFLYAAALYDARG